MCHDLNNSLCSSDLLFHNELLYNRHDIGIRNFHNLYDRYRDMSNVGYSNDQPRYNLFLYILKHKSNCIQYQCLSIIRVYMGYYDSGFSVHSCFLGIPVDNGKYK